MYKCWNCGLVFEEPKEWKEYRGECFGFPAYETMTGCPNCNSDYSEIEGDDEEDDASE